jgi:hypothetical protein
MLSSKMIAQFRPTNAELDEVLDRARVSTLARAEGETGLTPMLLIESADLSRPPRGGLWQFEWDATLLHVPFNEDDEKERVMRATAARLYTNKRLPRIAILSTEAWIVKQRIGVPHCQPRDNPERQAIIAVFLATLDGRCKTGHYEFERDASGRMTSFEWFVPEGEFHTPLLGKLFRAFAERSGFLPGE